MFKTMQQISKTNTASRLFLTLAFSFQVARKFEKKTEDVEKKLLGSDGLLNTINAEYLEVNPNNNEILKCCSYNKNISWNPIFKAEVRSFFVIYLFCKTHFCLFITVP